MVRLLDASKGHILDGRDNVDDVEQRVGIRITCDRHRETSRRIELRSSRLVFAIVRVRPLIRIFAPEPGKHGADRTNLELMSTRGGWAGGRGGGGDGGDGGGGDGGGDGGLGGN